MNEKGVSEVVSAVLLISLVLTIALVFSYIYLNLLYERQESIEGTFFEEIGLGCTPAYECSEWSKCKVDYNLDDLINEELSLDGEIKRDCVDSSGCAPEKTEEQVCSARELIDVKVVKEKGKEYVEVRDKDGNLISKISKDEESGTLYIDIYT